MPSQGTTACRVAVCLVLFFGLTGLLTADEQLQATLEKLRTENEALRQDLEQREAVIRSLTESLAIARTESELFQKQWGEAQLRAQMLGVNFADANATQAQRQLVETVRALYLAEAERKQLVDQLTRLLEAVQTNGDVAGEVERTKNLLAANDRATAARVSVGTLESAQVVDVNPKLHVVVLNVGLLHGAQIGMPFVVFRGDRVVAWLKIVEVRRNVCAALIEKVERDVTLTTSDTARVTKTE